MDLTLLLSLLAIAYCSEMRSLPKYWLMILLIGIVFLCPSPMIRTEGMSDKDDNSIGSLMQEIVDFFMGFFGIGSGSPSGSGAPVTSAPVTSGSVTSAPVTSGSVTSGSVTSGLALVAVGGSDEHRHPLASAESYDPESKTWTSIASMGTRRASFGLAALNNYLYAVDGWDIYNIVTNAESYDPDKNKWTAIKQQGFRGAESLVRSNFGLTTLNNNLYAVGGCNKTADVALATAKRYDPESNTWTSIASMSTRRDSLGLTTLNNNLYAVGGRRGPQYWVPPLASAESYDPGIDKWTTIASMGTKRAFFGLTTLNGNLYAVGGTDNKTADVTPLASAESYDPKTNKWTAIASMGTARISLGLTTLNGNLYAVGGYDGSRNGYLKTAERYDPKTNKWTAIASMGTARYDFGLTVI